jgi:RNA polymerase sigma-70 factor (ECF subfamily)
VLITNEAKCIITITTFKVGDVGDFDELYKCYSPALYGALNKLLKNKEQAEDALQNTFLKIWLHRESYDVSKAGLFTWMLNIARNEAIDVLRSKRHRQANLTCSIDVQELPDCKNPFVHLDYMDIYKSLFLLTPKDRNILEFCFFRGFTCEETAEILRMPCGTIKTRMQYSYRKLRTILKASTFKDASLQIRNSE